MKQTITFEQLKRLVRESVEKKPNLVALKKCLDKVDDSDDGLYARVGNWKIALGGYDMGYEISYKGTAFMAVNYEDRTCDVYDSEFFPKDVFEEVFRVLGCGRFEKDGDWPPAEDDGIDVLD
jgi:hypothetical protein